MDVTFARREPELTPSTFTARCCLLRTSYSFFTKVCTLKRSSSIPGAHASADRGFIPAKESAKLDHVSVI
jgi:hypothetical protein